MLIIIHVHFQLQSLEFVNKRVVEYEHVCCEHVVCEHVCCAYVDCEHVCYLHVDIAQLTSKQSVYAKRRSNTVHWPCSVPNKLMYHGKFPVEHARVRTRLLGTPE